MDFLSNKRKKLTISKQTCSVLSGRCHARQMCCVRVFDFLVSSALSTRKYHESSFFPSLHTYCLVITRKNKNVDSDFSTKRKLFQSILLLVTNKRRCSEDVGKMFGADAISANVAKHICVFEGKC